MEANDMKAMRKALEFADRELRAATEDDRYGDDLVYLVGCMREVASACRAALAAPPRVCDVNALESLTDFVEKTILTSDLLKDANGIVKSIAVASVRTALTIAYEPANLENAASEIRDECNRQEQGENNGSK